MKKLLVAAIGAAAAIGAFADTPNPITELRFESADFVVGETNSVEQLNANHGGTYWTNSVSAADNTYVIEAANPEGDSCPLPLGDNPTKALNVKTKFGNPLSVNVNAGGTAQEIDAGGVYFDSLVKFTVCDDCPTNQYEGAKIVLWLQENEDLHVTNLYVNAGYLKYDNVNGVQVSNAIYKCGTTIGPDFADKWHRVTIKAIANITTSTSTSVPGFAIFIDGSGADATKAECTSAKWDTSFTDAFQFTDAVADLKTYSLFPSLDQISGSKLTISNTSFDGTGSITDIAFYDVAPEAFAEDAVAAEVTGVIVDNVKRENIKTFAAAVEAANGASASAKITLNKSFTIAEARTFSGTAEITLDFAGFVLTNTVADAAITNSAAALIVTDSVGTGGIVCGDEIPAIYQSATSADAISVTGGNFWATPAVKLDENYTGTTKFISGGAFASDVGEDADHLVDGKAFGGESAETGLYPVVNFVPPTPTTYTVTVDLPGLDSHVTVAVVVNEETAVTAASYTVNEGDSVTVTYTADTGYVLDGQAVYEFENIGDNESTTAPTATAATYNITYYNGETPLNLAPATYTYGVGGAPLPSASADTGYQFAGWYDNAELTGDPVTSIATTATGAKVFYAKFSGKTFTIVTYTNGVVNTSKPFTYAGESVDPADPLYDSGTETWDGKFYTENGGSTEFAFDAAGELTQYAYATITAKSGGNVPDIPAGGEAECGTEEAAAAAAVAINKDPTSKAEHIAIPAGVSDAGTYLGYVEAVAVGTKVKVDFSDDGAVVAQTSANTDVVSEAVSAAVAAAAAAGSEGSGTASVSTVAGFYYSIVSGTSPTAVTTEGARVLGTGGSVNLTVPNKGPAGFYKVKVSARAAD